MIDENSKQYWIIPITCFVLVASLTLFGADVRANTPERYIEPPVVIVTEKKTTSLSPYVEFCNPGGFAPNKLIDNSTHIFNHHTCQWIQK